MSSLPDHVAQSDHNQDCALSILTQPESRDWAITMAFYAAVHLVEAGFSTVGIHTEKDAVKAEKGKHAFRSDTLKDHVAKETFEIYNTMRIASNNLRYLITAPYEGRNELFDKHYPLSKATELVTLELPKLRVALELRYVRKLTNK